MSCFKVQLKEMSNLDPMTLYFIPFVYVLSVIAIIYISLNTIRQIDLKIYSRLWMLCWHLLTIGYHQKNVIDN
jgi:hypothetical protein